MRKQKFLERELETMQTFRPEFVRGGEVKGVQHLFVDAATKGDLETLKLIIVEIKRGARAGGAVAGESVQLIRNWINGNVALQMAIRTGQFLVVCFLMSHGAQPSPLALKMASLHRRDDILHLFNRKGYARMHFLEEELQELGMVPYNKKDEIILACRYGDIEKLSTYTCELNFVSRSLTAKK